MTLVSDARAIARSGVRAVDPTAAIARSVTPIPGGVQVGRTDLSARAGGRLHLLAIGKAAAAMADAAARIAGPDALGLVVTPVGFPAPRSALPVRYGEHPVPGAGSFRAGHALLRYVRATAERDAVLFLISGGGSAVAEQPVSPLRATDLARTTKVLLASGAPIAGLNVIRRHLSEIKGGRLALATAARARATVAISDVVGDRPEEIASGPTVPDPTTFADALRTVRRYRIRPLLPRRVMRYLVEGEGGRRPETPKPGDRRFVRAPFVLAATNSLALAAARAEARQRGYTSRAVSGPMVGETQPAARRFARQLLRAGRSSRGPIALLAGGETTVTLGRRPGLGGRNQEFALATAPEIARAARAVVLSVGTDGIDGPTGAAGGWVDDRTTARAPRCGVDIAAALRHHASYDALGRLGSLLITGPTGTNVMDLHVGLMARARQSAYGRK